MKEELIKILNSVKNGNVEVEEAAEVIEFMKFEDKPSKRERREKGKMLRVQVRCADGDSINLEVPLNVAKTLIETTGTISGVVDKLNEKEIDFDVRYVSYSLRHDIEGRISNVKTAKGDVIQVFIE